VSFSRQCFRIQDAMRVDILVSCMGVWMALLNTKWLLPHDVLIVKAKGTSVRC
jgi:hypothetical protein